MDLSVRGRDHTVTLLAQTVAEVTHTAEQIPIPSLVPCIKTLTHMDRAFQKARRVPARVLAHRVHTVRGLLGRRGPDLMEAAVARRAAERIDTVKNKPIPSLVCDSKRVIR